MFKEITKNKRPFISLFVSLSVFKFRLYNKKGYVYFVLSLWGNKNNAPIIWKDDQMDYNGNYTFMTKGKK